MPEPETDAKAVVAVAQGKNDPAATMAPPMMIPMPLISMLIAGGVACRPDALVPAAVS